MSVNLRRRIQGLAKHHGSLRAAARVIDLDHGYLSRLQDGLKTEPSDETLRKLGMVRRVTYEITRCIEPDCPAFGKCPREKCGCTQ